MKNKEKNIITKEDETLLSLKPESKEKKEIYIGFFAKRRKTRIIINNLYAKKIEYLLFYSDVKNTLINLEYGIRPIENIELKNNDEYIVWNFLQKEKYIDLEPENSSRTFFWNWVIENKVKTDNIAIYVIDIKKMFELTKTDWVEAREKNAIRIFENIEPEAIKAVLIQKADDIEKIKKYVLRTKLDIQVYQGNHGNINDIVKQSKEENEEK